MPEHPTDLLAVPAHEDRLPARVPLVPERSDFLDGDSPAADKVQAFLANALAATGTDAPTTAGALVPWICDALLSNHSVKAYGRDLMDFLRHMQAQGVDPLHVTADHVRLYKRALLEAGRTSATVARRLSVLRGTYHQLAAKGLISWETAQDIAAVKAPGVQKNATPSLTQKQAIQLLEAIPSDTLQGIRDLAMMSVFFLTGCRVSAVVGACVGHLETDGVEHYLHVTEKQGKKRRKILLDASGEGGDCADTVCAFSWPWGPAKREPRTRASKLADAVCFLAFGSSSRSLPREQVDPRRGSQCIACFTSTFATFRNPGLIADLKHKECCGPFSYCGRGSTPGRWPVSIPRLA